MNFDRDFERMKFVEGELTKPTPKLLAQAIDELASSFLFNGIVNALLMDVKKEGLEARRILCKGIIRFCPGAISEATRQLAGANYVTGAAKDILEEALEWRVVDEEAAALLRIAKLYAKALKNET